MTENVMEWSVRIADGMKTLVAVDRFRLEPGKITFLFGESGIGKTLTAKAIFGLLDADRLQITLNGGSYEKYLASPSTRQRRDKGFFVFQEPSSHLDPLQRLGHQIRDGSLAGAEGEEEVFERLWGDDWKQVVSRLLPLYPRPARPSGGEKQRMLLVMAFKKMLRSRSNGGAGKGLFVFDEPTGSLDDALRNRFLRYLFSTFSSGGGTGLVLTHDYSIIGMLSRDGNLSHGLAVFKELVRHDGSLEVRDVSADDYEAWIDTVRGGNGAPSRTAEVLMSVASGMVVHGRKLWFSRDPEGAVECPLTVQRGALTYLKAASGTGKTSLAKALMGQVAASKVRVHFEGTVRTDVTPIAQWRRQLLGKRITMSFQHADEALSAQSTVADLFDGLPAAASSRSNASHLIGLLFDSHEFSDLRQRTVRSLSGGQRQKLNLIRCLSLPADVVVLDEPLNGMDLDSAKRVLDVFRILKKRGKGFLVISHNEEIFDAQADDVVHLHAVEMAPTRSSRVPQRSLGRIHQ